MNGTAGGTLAELEGVPDADLDSILGLDDDAEVINAVLRHLGLAEWQVATV